jgi:predicted DNA-binding transcriptional regulator AlpA
VTARRAGPLPPTVIPADPHEVLISVHHAGLIAGGLSPRTIYRLMAEGRFPRPVPILANSRQTTRSAWVLADVLAFNRERIAAARGKR